MGFLKDIDDTLGAITAPVGYAGRKVKEMFNDYTDEESDAEEKHRRKIRRQLEIEEEERRKFYSKREG